MAEQGENEGTTFTQVDIDNAVKTALSGVKAEDDPAFKSLWQEAKDAKARAKAFEGLDAEEARSAMAKLKELETEGKAGEVGVTSEQLKQIRQEVTESLEGDYLPYKTENDTLKGKLRDLQLDSVVKGIMGKNGVKSAKVEPLFKLTAERFELTDEGEPMLRDHPGRDVSKFVSENLAQEFPEWFEASGSSGGGASRSSGGAGGATRTVKQGDKAAMAGVSVEDIASGKVIVTR